MAATQAKAQMAGRTEKIELTIEEAYKRFPDWVTESGEIKINNGGLRYAFIEGARFALSHIHDGSRAVDNLRNGTK